jgi:hypothetical protein
MIRRKMIRKKMIDKKTACDQYENALLTAAASGGEPEAKLARHLEHCSTCRTALRLKRELLSRIDGVLRAQVNEEPRPGFLMQLRLKLSKEPTAQLGSNRVWHVAGAALALVLAVLYPLVSARQPGVQGNLVTPVIAALPSAGVTQSAHAAENLGVRSSRRYKRPAVQSAGPKEPEVLVPPDEQRAFAQYVALVAMRDVKAEALVSPAADNPVARNTELPGVASVDMAALQFNGAEPSE